MPSFVGLGEGASLERWRPELVPGLVGAFAAAERDLRDWMPSAAREQEDAAGFVELCVAAFESGRSYAYAVVAWGEVVGYVNVTPVGEVATVGYWLRPEARGVGLARAAVVALSSAVFASFPSVASVRAEVDALNLASQRVLEGAGFVLASSSPRPARTAAQSDTELIFLLERVGGQGAVEG